ncbi:hypothetical protein ILFOPFJJ_06926 [Ensifer psoraleae]|uniref:hypothetical protein n=1 Tax=Sinorhizobium psoraleae TaxID=520838 RepID=UPI001FE53B87|nr:hypothetical protein [Sinorhizobium psoraleae]NRP76002.1 hypothetical protein [Sinorhizobium psoraleae]
MFVKLMRINVVAGLFVSATISAAPATASEWGCEVLLCAASSNPSWRGVPSCHPPMMRLISAMKKPGFDWPTCPEAGTGSPGFERYAACPEGYRVGSSSGRDGFGRDENLCVRTVNMCQGKTHGLYHSDRQRSCMQTVSISRPLRSEPYFFDIKNDTSGQTERHWFELHR